MAGDRNKNRSKSFNTPNDERLEDGMSDIPSPSQTIQPSNSSDLVELLTPGADATAREEFVSKLKERASVLAAEDGQASLSVRVRLDGGTLVAQVGSSVNGAADEPLFTTTLRG